MDPAADQDPRVAYAFWIACALALIGGVAPLLFGPGTSSRVAGVIIPFAVAAAALAVDALMYQHGRPLAASLYFIAGIAIVYGILAMLSVPLRLAVIGTCNSAIAQCQPGFEQPLSAGENNGLGVAVGAGILAIFTGFFGLVVVYRRLNRLASAPPPPLWPAHPPEPATPTAVVAPAPAAQAPSTAPATVPAAAPPAPPEPRPPEPQPSAAAEAIPASAPATRTRPKRAPRPRVPRIQKSLPAPEALPELPAPEGDDEPGTGPPPS